MAIVGFEDSCNSPKECQMPCGHVFCCGVEQVPVVHAGFYGSRMGHPLAKGLNPAFSHPEMPLLLPERSKLWLRLHLTTCQMTCAYGSLTRLADG